MPSSKPDSLSFIRFTAPAESKIYSFLERIFHNEQKIPLALIPVKSGQVFWWGIKSNEEEILGIAASWKEKDEWHWGRFSIHPKLRGQGYGEKLASFSLTESFKYDIEYLMIEARDAVVPLIQKMGGTIVGETKPFYSENITPMKLEKENFKSLKT